MTSTLQRPAEPTVASSLPATAGPKPAPRKFQKWRNRALVVAMVVLAAIGGLDLVRFQAARASQLNLGELMLTSQPIPVETSLPGLVTAVGVHAGQRVTTGQELGAIEVTTTNSKGLPVLSHRILRAPRAGIVVDDPLTIGSTLQPGNGFAVLYDPADLTLVTDVPLSYLPQVAPGMTAQLKAEGVPGTVRAVLQRAVPRIGTSQQDVAANHLRLVFVPQDAAEVAHLIPGLRFTGTIDTRTGSRGTRPADHVA